MSNLKKIFTSVFGLSYCFIMVMVIFVSPRPYARIIEDNAQSYH